MTRVVVVLSMYFAGMPSDKPRFFLLKYEVTRFLFDNTGYVCNPSMSDSCYPSYCSLPGYISVRFDSINTRLFAITRSYLVDNYLVYIAENEISSDFAADNDASFNYIAPHITISHIRSWIVDVLGSLIKGYSL